MAQDDLDEFKRMGEIFKYGLKLKALILKQCIPLRGTRMYRGKQKCPFCKKAGNTKPDGSEHYVHARLYPSKRSRDGYHIHLACDGPCGTTMME